MSKYDYEYCGYTRWSWMESLAESIRRVCFRDIGPDSHQRDWHLREQGRYNMHPVIRKAVMAAPPADWHRLVLEWPHVSTSNDTSKIAYTRNDQHGIDDRQTVTSVGKYVSRHFPTLRDHEVRDLCAVYGASTFKISRDMDEMIDLLHKGPRSCMVWDNDDLSEHPYRVYDPALGWGLAVRIVGSIIHGRALINDTHKVFVRTYRRNDDGYSGSDESLNSWLNDQGYKHTNGWPYGARMKYIPVRKYGEDVPLAPYIDGNHQHISVHYGTGTMSIDSDGDWECNNTDGFASEVDSCTCSSCNERVSEDDLVSTYDGDGDAVCEACINEYYYYAYGRREYQYYVHSNDAVEVNGRWYHDEYLGDNNIVELYDGEYAHMDDVVNIDGDWYLTDDHDVVYCEDIEEYALREDCWQCYVTDKWYRDDEAIRLCDILSQDEVTVHEDEIATYESDINLYDPTIDGATLEWTPYPVYQTIEGA